MITGISYFSMKAMMKGYSIKINYSVAKGLTKTYTYDRLREDNSFNVVSTARECQLRQELETKAKAGCQRRFPKLSL
jgi:hypothetical protein